MGGLAEHRNARVKKYIAIVRSLKQRDRKTYGVLSERDMKSLAEDFAALQIEPSIFTVKNHLNIAGVGEDGY